MNEEEIQRENDEEKLETILQAEKFANFQLRKYQTQLKNLQKEKSKFPKCKRCRKPFVLHKMRKLTTIELQILEEMDDMEAENDSCYSRLNEYDYYCFDCIHILIHSPI